MRETSRCSADRGTVQNLHTKSETQKQDTSTARHSDSYHTYCSIPPARRPRSHNVNPCLFCWVELRSGPISPAKRLHAPSNFYSSQQLLIDLFTKPFHPSSLPFDIPLNSFICGNDSHFQLFLILACAKDVVNFISKLYCDLEQQVPQKEPPEARRRNHRREREKQRNISNQKTKVKSPA